MIEKKYLIARSDFHAEQTVKRVYDGRIRDYSGVLLPKRQHAVNKIQRYPLGQQELYEVYEVQFDKGLIRYG